MRLSSGGEGRDQWAGHGLTLLLVAVLIASR
jgi:hypothetical protein